ncbi:MAG: rod shape-determining protein MreC [Bacteroidota bacterium]
MRNFILFIRRFFNLILFLGLEIICIILIQHTNTMQGNDIVSSANTVAGIVYKKQSDVVYYFGLRRMNDSLLSENTMLRKKIDAITSIDTLIDSAVHRQIDVNDTSVHIVKYADYVYRTAKVINNSTNASNNYITLNRGAQDGVAKNMAVISGAGIVGRVEHVSAHYSSVLSILSSKQKVSAKLKDGTTGYIVWDEKKPDILIMTDVPQQAKIRRGDSVFTTSYSFFPPDLLIGRVLKIATIRKNNLQLLYLQSSTNFRKLQYVYVVENKMSQERKTLEDSSSAKK